MRKILIIMVISVFIMLFGCSPRMETETTVAAANTTRDVVERKEDPVEKTTEETIEEEPETKLEEEIFDVFLEYLEAAKNDLEYGYFSTQTKEIVGSESEYLSGAKTDIYYIVKEAHLTFKDIQLKSVVHHQGRALLTVTADRMVEGINYEDEEISWKFIMEDDWKIDFYYPLGILVMLNSPDIFVNNALNEYDQLQIDANIKSFFPITEIALYINGEEITPQVSEIDDFEKGVFAYVSSDYLISGLNDIEIRVRNVIGEQEFYLETFGLD
jgi:hypothetical protein